jgi:hypothetical protein
MDKDSIQLSVYIVICVREVGEYITVSSAVFSCSVAANCNRQKYQAKRAGEQSIELYLTQYIGLHGPLIEEAVVMDVKDASFDIIICSTGLVQRIYTNVSVLQVECHFECSLRKTRRSWKNQLTALLRYDRDHINDPSYSSSILARVFLAAIMFLSNHCLAMISYTSSPCPVFFKNKQTKQTPWPLVRERTIPTDRPPLVDET